MILQLIIQNYESHKKTVLDFVPGLNVFIGESDKGKSGAFRAFKKLRENSPGGQRMFPLYWKGEPSITAVFDDCKIIRNVSKNTERNTYQLDDYNPVGAGTSVPQEIQAAINMDDVNYQSQIDRAFLMFETAGERGRILNRYAGLDEIDTALSTGKSDVQELNRKLKAVKAEIKSKSEELEQFDDLEEQEQRLMVCEQLEQHTLAAEKRSHNLAAIAQYGREIEDKLQGKEELLEATESVKAAQSLLSDVSASDNRLVRLNDLRQAWTNVDGKLKALPDMTGATDAIAKAKGLLVKLTSSENRHKNIKNLLEQYNDIIEEIKSTEDEILELVMALPNKCPECGSIIE